MLAGDTLTTTEHRVQGAVTFADGSVARDFLVVREGAGLGTLELLPGAEFVVSFTVEPQDAGTFVVEVWPPRPGGRQVALGGPHAPPPVLAPDPRMRSAVAQGSGASRHATLTLPAPWHPKTATVMLRRLDAQGETEAKAIAGPRTADGRGLLALLDVQTQPTAVGATRAEQAPVLDGRLDDVVWTNAAKTTLVGSLTGEPVALGAHNEADPGLGPTQVGFAWDDRFFYVSAWLPDTDIRGTYTQRDEPLWKQEVFEVFVFGEPTRTHYLELQVSARGVVFDAKFERYRKGDEAWNSTWRTAVHLEGTVEHDADVDRGWGVEAAIPWTEICAHTPVTCPVRAGHTLRANVFRLERPARSKATIALTLSPTRVPDFHAPENAAVIELLP